MDTVPPMASTKPRTTDRPRPIPAEELVSPSRWNERNTASRAGSGIPRPSSATAMSVRACPGARRVRAVRRTADPGAWRRALSNRFPRTRSSRPWSAHTVVPAVSTVTRSRSDPWPTVAAISAVTAVSSTSTSRGTGRTAPAASREESSRLSTSEPRWSADSSMVASSSAVSSGPKSTSVARSEETESLTAANGVRRS